MLKLPVLIHHFFEHKQWDKNTTLVAYLRHHYLNGDKEDFDYVKDKQLPFKSSHCMIASVPVMVPDPLMVIGISPDPENRSFPKLTDSNEPSVYLKGIFRPPRLA